MLFYGFAFLSFVFFTFMRKFFRFSFIVLLQSVLFIGFSVLARHNELYKLSVHAVGSCFSKGTASFRAMAVGPLVPTVISEEWSFVSLPVCMRKHHNNLC
jgi:hypothetical protein